MLPLGITILPKDLNLNESKDLQLFNYRKTQGIQKTKINLSKNTISFLRTGTKEVIGDDKTVKIENEHFVIMKAGNCLMTEKVSDTNKIYHSVLLFFSDEDVLRFLEKFKEYSPKQRDHRSFYVFKYDNFIYSFVDSLEQILKLPKDIQVDILKNKFEEIMLYLIHLNNADFLNSLVYKADNQIIRLTNISENNKHNKLSVEELAFLCNMSLSTFKREFFKLYQVTPMKWFTEQRLNHAAFLLKTKRQRPIDLYQDAGYENFSNFVQAFKKKFGITPKQYQIQS